VFSLEHSIVLSYCKNSNTEFSALLKSKTFRSIAFFGFGV
jgi:hypothetical protein